EVAAVEDGTRQMVRGLSAVEGHAIEAHGRANFGDAVDVDAVDDEVLRRRAVDRDVEVEERQSLHERDGAGGGGVHDRVRYATRVLEREPERALTHAVVGEAVTVPGDIRAAAHDGHG